MTASSTDEKANCVDTPGLKLCAPAAWHGHKAAVTKASLAGLWAVKSQLRGARGLMGRGGGELLASKAPSYNGRGTEGVDSFTSGGSRDSTE